SELLLCHGMVCVVGRMRDLILQLSKSSIYSTKPCGIDLSLQKKIFDPFFTTKASGTGLGLALSQRIINAHQGDIRVASLPGYGATFTLILPINPQGNQTV
ncbi:ATP-binding protein, partial [Escherichia coli]|uniref:ATP-binding protein n=1 Tax=Escherichia coli TaxID=562 RepID=UPI0030793254